MHTRAVYYHSSKVHCHGQETHMKVLEKPFGFNLTEKEQCINFGPRLPLREQWSTTNVDWR